MVCVGTDLNANLAAIAVRLEFRPRPTPTPPPASSLRRPRPTRPRLISTPAAGALPASKKRGRVMPTTRDITRLLYIQLGVDVVPHAAAALDRHR